jgi:peptidoglycan/xylan/chitin deacetylase (PgdA/CDA1 family)
MTLLALATLVACTTPLPAPVPGAAAGPAVAAPQAKAAAVVAAGVVARSNALGIYLPRDGETYATIAQLHLGNAARAWELAELNGDTEPRPGKALVLPLRPVNPVGVRAQRFQTVPILCYHRIGPGNGKMVVSSANFAQQLEWLRSNGYSVVRLGELVGFLAGHHALPPRSVVLSFDDGYESVYRHAFPLLKRFGVPATLFLYTDFVGSGSAMSWAQVREMRDSGLVDVQAHSKSHANLIERLADENDAGYMKRLDAEARVPREAIERHLNTQQVLDFAYPYGDANEQVLEVLARQRYRLAVTVNPGGNPFYAQPLMLRRTMILGNLDLDAFKSRLVVSRPIEAP